MATITKGKTFTNGEVVTPATLHQMVDSGTVTNIVNADISASAAIAHSKLANITAGQVLLGNASNVPTATALSGDVTVNSSGVTAIGTGVIVNADINASAAIAHSKLANITAGQVLLGNASNVPTATALSGDVTVNSSGVTAIEAGVIATADIADATSTITGVTNSKLRHSSALSVVGRSANSTGAPADIAAGTDHHVLRRNGTALGFGLLTNNNIDAAAAIADTKLATISTAGKVANTATTATSDNTADSIVSRDGNGTFSTSSILCESISSTLLSTLSVFRIYSATASGQAYGAIDFHRGLVGAIAPYINFYQNGAIRGTITPSGTNSVAYNTTSDYRLKTNLEPLTDAVARLIQIPVHRFNWIADPSGNKVDGFLAHEAQAIVPECVTGYKDEVDAEGKPIYQGIDQSKLVPLLVAAVQELAAKVAVFEKQQ